MDKSTKIEYKVQRLNRLYGMFKEAHADKHCDHDIPRKYLWYTYWECPRCHSIGQDITDMDKIMPWWWRVSDCVIEAITEIKFFIDDFYVRRIRIPLSRKERND